MQIAKLKKALASKEGEKVLSSNNLERSKYTTEITPPRSRRLSIENSVVRKSVLAPNVDDKKVVKSPLPRPEVGTEHGSIRSRRLSLEGSLCVKTHRESKTHVG